MKIFSLIVLSLLSSQSVLAEENDLLITGAPLIVIANNKHQYSLKTCKDYIFLRMNDLKIENLPDLPDRDMWTAKDSLVHCYIDWYTQHNALKNSANPSSLQIDTIIAHFPASATLTVSNEDVKKLQATGEGKTMLEYMPSLHLVDNHKMISTKGSVEYSLQWYQTYKNHDNQEIQFVTIGSGVLEGTLGILSTYKIINKNAKPWQVQQITENSPF